jgi:glycosyltransferase involved in cell wall biosynthesis
LIKVIHISASDKGGAGRAAHRIHKSLLNIGVKSQLWVNRKKTKDPTVFSHQSTLCKVLAYLKPYTRIPFLKLLITKNPILHSPAIFSSSWIKKINQSDADVVNLHWVQHEMLSISDIAKIIKPVVWTLHDMWAFCGAEHISWDKRWKNGYTSSNRPSYEKGFDLNKWTWERKKKYWKNFIYLVAPSNWLTKCIQNSRLMSKWPVSTIGNPIDTNFWKPKNKNQCRDFFGFSKKDKILLYGTYGSNLEFHKGFDLLKKTLKKITHKNAKLVIFGDNTKVNYLNLNIQVINIGFVKENKNLKYLYCAADAMIIPSRIESFGQIAAESSACGTPVVAFGTGGLKDIIEHKKTGYLAKSFKCFDLANGIDWVLSLKNKKKIKQNARRKILDNFDNNFIAKKYLKIYSNVLKSKFVNKNF